MSHTYDMDEQLTQLINQTPFLSGGDKSFLIEKLSVMTPLDKLKLRGSLLAGQAPPILQSLQMMRAKFYEKEAPKKPDLFSKIASVFVPQPAKKIIATSVLSQPQILGGPAPKSLSLDGVPPLEGLDAFRHPGQVALLKVEHINFNINSNTEQTMQNFLDTLTRVFDQIEDVNHRRNYFMNFLQSPLFSSYVNTGLTALRHPELEPAKIILNLLYQINPNYLNNRQFQHAAIICNHLRHICSL